jgi:hypothetical protein
MKHTRLRPTNYLPHVFADVNSMTEEPMSRFEQRLAQADSYLQILIQQIAAMESKPELADVVTKANEFLDAVKHSIVLLQIAKVRLLLLSCHVTSYCEEEFKGSILKIHESGSNRYSG